jgi:hypothetical protein
VYVTTRPVASKLGLFLLVTALGLVPALAGPAAGGATTAPAATRSASASPLAKPRVPTDLYLGVNPGFDPALGTGQQAGTFTAESGRPPAVVSFYIKWTQSLPVDLGAVSAAGSVPLISWACSDTHSDAQVAAGAEDPTIRAAAQAYKAFGKPVFLRWFWEMNLPRTGNHPECLGSTTSSVAQTYYRAAWQHIWTIFQSVGATNVAFVWAPSAAAGILPSTATGFYPGNQYVDWIGADLYDRGYSVQGNFCVGPNFHDDFGSLFANFYNAFSAPTYGGKPFFLTETGAPTSTEQVAWLKSIDASLRSFPRLHGVVYFDAEAQCDYVLQPGSAGLAEFRTIGAQPYLSAYPVPVDTYGFATASGSVHIFNGYSYGGTTGSLPAPIVGFAEGPNASGYWLTGADGSIYPFGGVSDLGSLRGKHLNRPIVAMAATPDGHGYWLVATDGGMFAFGDAKFHGSMGGRHLNRPIVGMAATGDGGGYWLVASDGGMFAFGDAKFRGSMGGRHLNKPIDGMSSTVDGRGYWLVASDGGIFSFGDARFGGSLGGQALSAPVSSAARDLLNGYYVVLTSKGTVYQFPGGTVASASNTSSPAVQISTWPIG